MENMERQKWDSRVHGIHRADAVGTKGHENPPQSPFNKVGSPICYPPLKRGARGDLRPYFRSNNEGKRMGMTEEGVGTMDHVKCYRMLQNVTNVTWVFVNNQGVTELPPPTPFVT
jgi:hypothetical protein